jgi:hypothetical protein
MESMRHPCGIDAAAAWHQRESRRFAVKKVT